MASCVGEHIVKQIDENFVFLLIDEARNELTKKQMSFNLRFVYSFGIIRERFLDIIHVTDTRSELLMDAIVFTLSQNKFFISCTRTKI